MLGEYRISNIEYYIMNMHMFAVESLQHTTGRTSLYVIPVLYPRASFILVHIHI